MWLRTAAVSHSPPHLPTKTNVCRMCLVGVPRNWPVLASKIVLKICAVAQFSANNNNIKNPMSNLVMFLFFLLSFYLHMNVFVACISCGLDLPYIDIVSIFISR